jgi:hypothetical protein
MPAETQTHTEATQGMTLVGYATLRPGGLWLGERGVLRPTSLYMCHGHADVGVG